MPKALGTEPCAYMMLLASGVVGSCKGLTQESAASRRMARLVGSNTRTAVGFAEGTFAGTDGNGKDAPGAVIPSDCDQTARFAFKADRGGGRSLQRRGKLTQC